MIKPLFDRVLVSPDKTKDTTESGIILTNNSKDKSFGVVLAVGPGKRKDDGEFIPMDVKIGDRVLFSGYGTEDTGEGLLVAQDNIYAIIE